MSQRTDALSDAISRAFLIRGGSLIKKARVTTITQFVAFCWDTGMPIPALANVRGLHVKAFVVHMLSQGLTVRTLQTKLGHIRQCLRAAGRNGLADDPKLTNAALGAGGGSRKGTNAPISPKAWAQVLACAEQRSPELQAGIRVALFLGLRAEETVQAGPSLARWQRELAAGHLVYVTRGTKGGKTRFVLPVDREQAMAAVGFAIQVKGRRKNLYKQPTLKKARKFYDNEWLRHLKPASGEGSTPHSLRYRYAQDLEALLLTQGFTKDEAGAVIALCLGHGDGRGRYMHLVYGQHPLLAAPSSTDALDDDPDASA